MGLSLEMLWRPVDALFVPAHTVSWIHPQKTIVVVHGLEYEMTPQAYSFWERIYMRFSIRNSCRWAKKIISVSKNTKNDLVELYGVDKNKISVVYEGYATTEKFNRANEFDAYKPYLLFIGRLEERKNIKGIIESFEILKRDYQAPHRLVLAGRGGYGYDDIQEKIEHSLSKKDIIKLGFMGEESKNSLIKGADIFLFPTLYEGFGIPILEAQSLGVPVITSNISSMPEVAGNEKILADPKNAHQIAKLTFELSNNQVFREETIRLGYANAQKFSWEKCAQEIARIILN
jgi:glycosyltransferase involved in cell wall biosynthesis